MAEYSELENDKRAHTQAMLAVAGLLAAGGAAIVTQVSLMEPLPIAALAPITFGAIWLAVGLRGYIWEMIHSLVVVEGRINELLGRTRLTRETQWLREYAGHFTEIRTMSGAIWIGLGFSVFVLLPSGLWALAASPTIQAFPQSLQWVVWAGYGLLCLILGSLALQNARRQQHKVEHWATIPQPLEKQQLDR